MRGKFPDFYNQADMYVPTQLKHFLQELKQAHNALGMVNRFTFALLRAELSAVEGT
jgi:hypothetical protein